MPWVKDYYGILGCSPAADPVVIRAAWKALLAKHHPDIDRTEEGARRLALVNEAWGVLGDAEARGRYDASLRAPDAMGRRPRAETAPSRLTQDYHRQSVRLPGRRWRGRGPVAVLGAATLGTFATAAALAALYTPQGVRNFVDSAWAARPAGVTDAATPALDLRRMTTLRAELERRQDGAGAEAAARMMRLDMAPGRCLLTTGDATADARAVCPSLGLVAHCAQGRGTCRAHP